MENIVSRSPNYLRRFRRIIECLTKYLIKTTRARTLVHGRGVRIRFDAIWDIILLSTIILYQFIKLNNITIVSIV